MKRIKLALGFMVLAVPVLVFANVWFAFRSYTLEEQVHELQNRQLELIERNKWIITGISVLRSPGRIIEEARKQGMVMPDAEQIIIIQDDS